MAQQHRGEERLLIFRSDRNGAIAKIIYSIDSTDGGIAGNEGAAGMGHGHDNETTKTTSATVQAKIHVLDVKQQYRGNDLGALLFSEAMAILKERYFKKATGKSASIIHCKLDAEEDCARYDRLIAFYQKLGCQIIPHSKERYMHNNDGGMFRRVPMQISLHSGDSLRVASKASMLLGTSHFLPFRFIESTGRTIAVGGDQISWLVVENDNGGIRFRTTQGKYLQAEWQGACSVVTYGDDNDNENEKDQCIKASTFNLYRASDKEEISEPESTDRKDDLFILRSIYGTYLTADACSLHCVKAPSYWKAKDLSLTSTSDTPSRRRYYDKWWRWQTLEYVMAMRERYLAFELTTMSLKDGLNMLNDIASNPFQEDSTFSLRTLSYATAEVARHAGQPDWVQLIALVHHLGGVAPMLDLALDLDWTIASCSRIVGCAAPKSASFRHCDEGISPQGMYPLHCGLKQVIMAWTGPEYMYHMLQHNHIPIPEEGLAMLRFFTLEDWHAHNGYSQLTNQDDSDVQPFIAEFAALCKNAREKCMLDLSDVACETLWEDHYKYIVSKYSAESSLCW
jgi:inositol oxygenase